MLVLLRCVRQTIYIGADVVVELREIKKGRIRVGIRAPRNVPIDRPEFRAGKPAAPPPDQSNAVDGETSFLIVSRRPGECILIGQDITVSILSIKGAAADFGIDAPAHIVVDRGEIFLRKQAGELPRHARKNKRPQMPAAR